MLKRDVRQDNNKADGTGGVYTYLTSTWCHGVGPIPVRTWTCLGTVCGPGAGLDFENKVTNHCTKQMDSDPQLVSVHTCPPLSFGKKSVPTAPAFPYISTCLHPAVHSKHMSDRPDTTLSTDGTFFPS